MNVPLWLQLVLVVEGFALAGVVVALASSGTRWVFALGFAVMAPVALLIAGHGSGPAWRRSLIVALVAAYVARMAFVLIAWLGSTGAAKLGTAPVVSRVALPVILTNTCGWLYCATARRSSGRHRAPGRSMAGTARLLSSTPPARCFTSVPTGRSGVSARIPTIGGTCWRADCGA